MRKGTIVLAISLDAFTMQDSNKYFLVIRVNGKELSKVREEFQVKSANELVGKNVALDMQKHRIFCLDKSSKGEGVPCHFSFA